MAEEKNQSENKISEKFEDVKKGIGSWWIKSKPKFHKMAKTAGSKATEVKEKGRVKYNLFQERRNLEKLYLELGEIVFDEINDNKNYTFSKNNDVKDIVTKIIAKKYVIGKYVNEYDNIGNIAKKDNK